VLAGTLPPTPGCPNGTVCHHLLAGHQAAWGHGGLQGPSYHKFLDSHAQEQGVWSRFSSNRWSASRDRFWSRTLPNPSVRNSSSYFFPPNVDMAAFIAWHFFFVSCHVPWMARVQMAFRRAVSLEALQSLKEKHWPKHKQKRTLNLFHCHIALPPQRQAVESRSKHTCLQNNKCISQS